MGGPPHLPSICMGTEDLNNQIMFAQKAVFLPTVASISPASQRCLLTGPFIAVRGVYM